MKVLYLSLFATTALTACGGATTSIQPISSYGFAGQTNSADTPVFTLLQSPRILRSGGDDTRLENQDITISIPEAEGSDAITVDLDGKSYQLSRTQLDDIQYQYSEGGDFIELEVFSSSEDVVLAELFSFFAIEGGGDNLNDGWVLIGADTNPREIAALNGSANFSGTMEATLRQDDYRVAFGDGSFTLTADFSSGQISGSGSIYDQEASNADFAFDDVNVAFADAEIVGNGFQGNISLSGRSIDGLISEAGY